MAILLHRLLPPLFMLLSVCLTAQEHPGYRCSVTDAATGLPLPYAAVSLSGTTLGTVTNNDGVFTLSVPALNPTDTLLVSYLGYRLAKVSAVSLKAGGVIALQPAALHLPEVEVVALTPEEVIRRVVEAIPGNYGTEPILLTAYVRSRKMLNNRLAEFTEAVIQDLKAGYTLYRPGEERSRRERSNLTLLLKGRVDSDTALVNLLGDAGRDAGCLSCNFIHDAAEFYRTTILDASVHKFYDLRMKEQAGPDGRKVYSISFDQKPGTRERLWRGELVVDGPTFAILKLTQRPSYNGWDQYEKEKRRRSWYISGMPGWIAEMPVIDRTVSYEHRGGRWILSTIRDEEWITFIHPADGKRLRLGFRNEVVVTASTTDSLQVRNFNGGKNRGVGQRWDQIAGTPDPKFWEGFNYLPIEEKIRKDIIEIRSGH